MNSSNPSVETPPEFALDRSLGQRTAEHLRALGWLVQLPPGELDDVDWIEQSLDRGWGLLSKDRRIRFLGGGRGPIFVLSSPTLGTAEMARWFDNSRDQIDAAVTRGEAGLWMVSERRIARRK